MIEEYASRLIQFLPSEQDIRSFTESEQSDALLQVFDRMTTWIRLLHGIRGDDETIALLAAAHSKVIEIWILVPLGLIHSSYTALRTFVDICASSSALLN